MQARKHAQKKVAWRHCFVCSESAVLSVTTTQQQQQQQQPAALEAPRPYSAAVHNSHVQQHQDKHSRIREHIIFPIVEIPGFGESSRMPDGSTAAGTIQHLISVHSSFYTLYYLRRGKTTQGHTSSSNNSINSGEGWRARISNGSGNNRGSRTPESLDKQKPTIIIIHHSFVLENALCFCFCSCFSTPGDF